MSLENRLLDAREAAAFIGVNPGTLAKWRCQRSDGPAFVRAGRAIRYHPADLADFVARHRYGSTSEYGAS